MSAACPPSWGGCGDDLESPEYDSSLLGYPPFAGLLSTWLLAWCLGPTLTELPLGNEATVFHFLLSLLPFSLQVLPFVPTSPAQVYSFTLCRLARSLTSLLNCITEASHNGGLGLEGEAYHTGEWL